MRKIVFLSLLCIVVLGGLLRFYHITVNPPGLYVDEVSIGLNAYDILKTGKDQYGVLHPLTFAAFGEYKMPVYIYLTAVSMDIFGKNEFAIRFPSAFFGTATIFVLFFLCRILLGMNITTKKYADSIALVGSALLAISSWHIHFSRAGFEATVALFFYVLAFLLFLYFLKTKKNLLIFLASLALVITFYTYDGYRLLVPLTIAVGFLTSFFDKNTRNSAVIAAIIFCIFALPLLIFTVVGGGLIRFQQTSAFSDVVSSNPWQKYVMDLVIFAKNYLSYFSPTFLFRFGDQFNRHQVQGFGLLYLWQLPYIIVGLYFLSKTTNKIIKFFVLFLLLAGPIAPALTKPSPHTLRSLYEVIPYTILTVLGLYQLLLQKTKWVKIVLVATVVFAVIELTYYLHYYYIHYPREALNDWGGACKEVAAGEIQEYNKGNKVIIDTSVPCVSVYFSFYSPLAHVTFTPENVLPTVNGKTILITAPNDANKNRKPGKQLYNIYLPNLNHDIFAQFWQL